MVNWVDLAAIALVVCSGLLSAMRGFVREVLGIGAWIGAGFWAASTFSYVQPSFRANIQNVDLADAAAFSTMFLLGLVFLWVIAAIVGGLVRGSMLGGLDRMLGVVFGFARGAALVVAAYILGGMVIAPQQWPESVLQAHFLPLTYEGAAWASGLFPDGYQPHVTPPPPGRETRAAEISPSTPAARLTATPLSLPTRPTTRLHERTPPMHRAQHDPDDVSGHDDKPHEECGVFGIWNQTDAAAVVALGLHALQHRGQEATGIVSYDGHRFHSHKGLGLVGDNFGDARVIAGLPGTRALGHNRYATTGDTVLRNVQPLYADFEFGGFAVAHNGNLTNATSLHRALVRRGCLFQSTTDSEVFIHLIAISLYSTVVDRLIDALKQVIGAYSIIAMSDEALMGVRDPLGVRPLILGRIKGGEANGGWVLASETCALDIVGADFVRDVEPGEIVIINDQGVHSIRPFSKMPSRFCVFEYIYFARPDSVVEGMPVYDARKRIGAELARESHVPADVIVPVPDSGVPAAMGYAHESGVPFELGIIRNHYVGRTFIEPTDTIRHLGVKLKHSANKPVLEGKRVILVDDSIVRGTTSRKIVEMVRAAGAAEVHMRISSPPTTHSCFYGIDTPERSKLLAARHNVGEMADLIGADSLAFISIDGLYHALNHKGRDGARPQYCDACFTGEYPIALPDMGDNDDRQLSLLTESRW